MYFQLVMYQRNGYKMIKYYDDPAFQRDVPEHNRGGEKYWKARAIWYAKCVYDLLGGDTRHPQYQMMDDGLIDPVTHEWRYDD